MRARGLVGVSFIENQSRQLESSLVGAQHAAPLQLEIESTFLLQKSEVAEDVLLDFLRRGFGIDLLQIHNNLLDGVLAVAALDDLQAGAVQAQGALGHEQHALLVVFAQTAAGSEAWTTA